MMNSDFLEWMGSLVRPMPYLLFCDKLREFTPKEFVRIVADFFRQWGGDVEIGPVGANGGIDILWRIADEDYIIQCKKWKDNVGVATVREVYGAAVKHQVKGAFIVATSKFTSAAESFLIDLRGPTVRLIDGRKLFDLMKQHMPNVVADIQAGIRYKGSED